MLKTSVKIAGLLLLAAALIGQIAPPPSSSVVVGDGASYIESGLGVTTPTSGLVSFNIVSRGASAGATCTNPTATLLGGTQAPGNATGGGTFTLNVTGTPGTQTIDSVSVGTPGNYSWPPGMTVHGCTGSYQIDAVLNEATMTTLATAAGVLVSNGVRYSVPAYTHTYPLGAPGFYCDFFNTATRAWVTDPGCAGMLTDPPHVLMQYVFVGVGPSWPNGPGSTKPPQIYQVVQIPGVIPVAGRVWTVLQQGAGQASQVGRSYPCMITPDDGNGGCAFNGRFFSVKSLEGSVAPYTETLDGGPQIVVAREVPGRAGKAGDLTGSFGAESQMTNGVLMQTFQIAALTVDPSSTAPQGGIVFATANLKNGGASTPVFEAVRGLTLCNHVDACAYHWGADTISLHNRLNEDSNYAGLYVGLGLGSGFYGSDMRTTNASINQNLTVAGSVVMPGLSAASGTPNSICQNNATKEVTVNPALTCTVSSLAFKHDFKSLDDGALRTVMGMIPGSFYYNDSERPRIGFAAEYMADLDPRLADGFTDEGPRSIDQAAILAVVVKAVQELNDKLNELKESRDAEINGSPVWATPRPARHDARRGRRAGYH